MNSEISNRKETNETKDKGDNILLRVGKIDNTKSEVDAYQDKKYPMEMIWYEFPQLFHPKNFIERIDFNIFT